MQELMKYNMMKLVQQVNYFSSVNTCIFEQLHCIVKWSLNFFCFKVCQDWPLILEFRFV